MVENMSLLKWIRTNDDFRSQKRFIGFLQKFTEVGGEKLTPQKPLSSQRLLTKSRRGEALLRRTLLHQKTGSALPLPHEPPLIGPLHFLESLPLHQPTCTSFFFYSIFTSSSSSLHPFPPCKQFNLFLDADVLHRIAVTSKVPSYLELFRWWLGCLF
ncbi:hypothetical protein CEXT_31601 [Caerostris extrusa]|uniref:Uncharacterized protein n=1 Tax=Caerostris extrusa TaxID=172846 RepID=A0AAV4UFC1_CAEEX|nr:hypothetical protein CEXT_31601 [Caerostris extrusa]